MRRPAPTARTVAQIRDGVIKPDVAIATDPGGSLDSILDADGAEVGGAMAGINHYLSALMESNDTIPGDYLAEVIALKKAIGTAANDDIMYYHDNKDGVQQAAVTLTRETTAASAPPAAVNNVTGMPIGDGGTYDKMIVPPSKQGTADLPQIEDDGGAASNAFTIPQESFDRSKKAKDYTLPNAGDFATKDEYDFALARYYTLTIASTASNDNDSVDQRAAYVKEKAVYDAYIALQKLIQADDMDVITDWQASLITKAAEGVSVIDENVLPPTGRDGMLHPYSVTLTPSYTTAADIVVRVNQWQTLGTKVNRETDATNIGMYKPPVLETGYTDGYNSLTIGVNASAVKKALPPTPSVIIQLPLMEFPAGSAGFGVYVANAEGSGIAIPGGSIDMTEGPSKGISNGTALRTTPQMSYNICDMGVRAAPIPNLQEFLGNGGTIYLEAPAGFVISEVMWGTDLSLDPHTNSQWIEVKNTTGVTASIAPRLAFIAINDSLANTDSTFTVIDNVGTGGLWSINTKGQGGRTGTGEKAADVGTVVSPQALVSMQRRFKDKAQTMPYDGMLATSWEGSARPALNFDTGNTGARIGSPGDEPINPLPPLAPPPPPPPLPTTPIAGATDIMITEIMVDTSSDRLPQWIELTHVGTGKVSLGGWTMVIDNAIDADVLGGGNAITVKLDGAMLDVSTDTRNAGKGQSLLAVAWASGRKSDKIHADRVLNLAPQLGQKGRYQLLSYDGFRVALVPPQKGAIATFGDIAGNLDEEWDIMMLEGAKRSSLIRREMSTAGAALNGTEAAGWILASATPLIAGPETYYGDDEDAGTPGYDAGGPLPVELSHFRPARDKQTGQVVITWATQSELNNAGFFIKRSNQRDGDFKVINATMIAGAGTMSEKQFYTYTDTTAQPNVVYYYQIEDVSLDGNRQLLTRGTRLKGHIGAAGKATVIWGDLKASHE